MKTECNPEQLEFHALGRREVIGRFDGGRITSDGGGLLLREVDQRLGLLDDTVTVSLPGGQLVVSWRGDAEPVWLTGNAELISEGKIDL